MDPRVFEPTVPAEQGSSEQLREPEHSASTVISIGGSAGGVAALKELLSHVSPDIDASFVVLLHRQADRLSQLRSVLAAGTELEVVEVVDGATFRPGCVFVSPPGKQVVVGIEGLHLVDLDPQSGTPRQIDRLLISTADSHGARAAGVLISGTSSDGTAGAVAIHQVGGLVLTEDPGTASFPEMGRSALATGSVTAALGLADLAAAIEGFAEGDRESVAAEWGAVTTSGSVFDIKTVFESRFSVPLESYKAAMVRRRIGLRLEALELGTIEEYHVYLAKQPDELERLFSSMLINVTEFFRDPAVFERIEQTLVDELKKGKERSSPLRCWIPACATGEEAYSLAMVLERFVQRGELPGGYEIQASDIHEPSLHVAQQGLYPIQQIDDIPEHFRDDFTEIHSGEYFRVRDSIRSRVNFSQHDLLSAAPNVNVDLVSCRNLLIYLTPQAKEKALSLLHFALRPNGILVVGRNETRSNRSGFEWLDRKLNILRKGGGVPRATREALMPHNAQPDNDRRRLEPASDRGNAERNGRRQHLATYDALLDRFVPAGFLVDRTGALQEAFGAAHELVGLPGRRPSLLLWDLLGFASDSPLADAVLATAKDASPRAILATLEPGQKPRQISVEPLLSDGPSAESQVLVLLDPETLREPEGQAFLNDLGRDLSHSKAEIDRLTDQLRTSTEELQAANEELVVSNEELRSSNEELHTVNLELETLSQERHATINRLRQATRDFSGLLRSSNVGALFLGSDFDIRLFTTSAGDFFSLIPEDLGRDFRAFSGRFREIDLQQLLEDARDSDRRFHGEVRDREGRAFLLDVSRATADSGEGLFSRDTPFEVEEEDRSAGYILTLVDLEQLSEARARGERLAALVESSTELIVSLDFDGNVVHWNRGATSLLGFSSEAMLGSAFEAICSEAARDDLRELEQLALGGKEAASEGVEFRSADGEPVILAVSLSPVYVSGKLVGSACLGRDVTVRRQMEATLRENDQVLRLELARREQFLAMLSHELRNPMNAVSAATRVAVHPEAEEASRERALGSIARQTDHLRRLLDDLLDVSRVTQNKLELKQQNFDLREPMLAALESAEAFAGQFTVKIQTSIPDKPIPFSGDPDRLQQLASNLLNNAVKFAAAEAGLVEFTVESVGGEVVIHCRDNGSGVPPDLEESIFNLFVQSDSTLERSAGGMGLGLTLVRAIARLHGGTVKLRQSARQLGAHFTVHLPISAVPGTVSDASVGDQPAASLDVLVVEDLADSRDALATILELDGHRVVTAAEGLEGLARAEAEIPDLVLCDIGLPGLDGYEVARRIRANPGLQNIRLVALTGYGTSDDVEAAKAAGFDAHLTKPLQAEALNATIARLFSE